MLNNRIFSFICIFLVYVIATIVGILLYKLLSLPIWASLLIADIVATIITFCFSVIFKNASVYDPYWSVQPIVIVLAFATGAELNVFKIVMIVAIFYWGLRLTANWAYTFKGFNEQDWRYTNLQNKTKKLYPIVNFLGIHMFPTLVVYLCTLPAVYTIVSPGTPNAFSYIFIALSFASATLQLVADMQMHNFRKKGINQTMNTGIWSYSRHPNYLGEVLMWWGICLASVCTIGFAWYLFLGAIINTLMFLFISIPLAENKLKDKPGFAEYKQTTSMLLILPHKKPKN